MVAVAVELDLFSMLASPATLAEVCAARRLHPRPAEALLNGLCAIDVLVRAGDRYRTGPAAASRPEPADPAAGWQYPLWTRLRALLETGEPQGLHAELEFCPDEVALRRFVDAADRRSAHCGPALAEAVDWRDASTVVDLGGARGSVLADVLRAHHHLEGTSFDLPVMGPLFDEHADGLGPRDRMSFHGGDFFADELPPADAYLLGHLLSDWDDDRCAHLVARAADALAPHGMLLLHDTLVDPDRPHTDENWVHSLHAQLIGPGGTPNTTGDCREWFAAAGLTDIRVLALVDTETLVIGTRPGG
jgi:8-O-methyltransferase